MNNIMVAILMLAVICMAGMLVFGAMAKLERYGINTRSAMWKWLANRCESNAHAADARDACREAYSAQRYSLPRRS